MATAELPALPEAERHLLTLTEAQYVAALEASLKSAKLEIEGLLRRTPAVSTGPMGQVFGRVDERGRTLFLADAETCGAHDNPLYETPFPHLARRFLWPGDRFRFVEGLPKPLLGVLAERDYRLYDLVAVATPVPAGPAQ